VCLLERFIFSLPQTVLISSATNKSTCISSVIKILEILEYSFKSKTHYNLTLRYNFPEFAIDEQKVWTFLGLIEIWRRKWNKNKFGIIIIGTSLIQIVNNCFIRLIVIFAIQLLKSCQDLNGDLLQEKLIRERSHDTYTAQWYIFQRMYELSVLEFTKRMLMPPMALALTAIILRKYETWCIYEHFGGQVRAETYLLYLLPGVYCVRDSSFLMHSINNFDICIHEGEEYKEEETRRYIRVEIPCRANPSSCSMC